MKILVYMSLLFGLLLVSAAPADAGTVKKECRKVASKSAGSLDYSYCSYAGDSRSRVLVYYFHSIFSSPHEWEKLAPKFYKWLDEAGNPHPHVIAVSFGRDWFLSNISGSKTSDRFRYLTNDLMPTLEKSVGFQTRPSKRFVVGASMGGFNGIQLYLHRPDLWDAAAFACPALSTTNPYDSLDDISKYAKRTNAKKEWILFALWRSRVHFKSREEWEKASPLTFSLGRDLPRILIYGGDRDRFGFQEGAGLFARQLEEAGVSVNWSLRAGDHCPDHSDDVARFLYDGMQ